MNPPASPKAKAKKAAPRASPKRGGKKVKAEEVKDEPAELDAVKAEEDAADAGEEEPLEDIEEDELDPSML